MRQLETLDDALRFAAQKATPRAFRRQQRRANIDAHYGATSRPLGSSRSLFASKRWL